MKRRVALALFLAVLLGLPLLAVYTGAGARALLPLAARLAGIEIQYAGGSLAGTLQLERLSLQGEGLTLDVRQIALQADLRCLWQGALCLRELGIGAVTLSLHDSTAQAPDAPVADAPFAFPIPVTVRSLRIGSARVEWPGGAWSQGAAQLGLRLAGSEVSVEAATIAGAVLALDGAAQQQAGTTGNVPPAIALPLRLRLAHLTLAAPQLSMSGKTYALRQLSLAGEWQGDQLRLDSLRVDSAELGRLVLRDSALQLRDNWPLQAAIELTAPGDLEWPALAGRKASVSIAGDLAALEMDIDMAGEPALLGGGSVNLLAAQPVFAGQFVVDAGAPIALADYLELPASVAGMELLPPATLTIGGSTAQQELTVAGSFNVVHAGAVAVDASAHLTGDRLAIDALSLRRRDGDDSLLIKGQLDWADGFSWDISAKTPGLALPTTDATPLAGHLAGSLSSSGSLRDGAQHIAFDSIALAGEVGGAPARIEGAFAVDGGELTPDSALRARLPGAQLSLRPAADAPGTTAVSLQVRDFGQWLPGLAGEINVNGRIDSAGRSSLRGDLAGLSWNGLQAQTGSLSASYDARDGGFDLRLALDAVQTPAGRSDSLLLTGDGDRQQLRAQLTGEGAVAGELAVVAVRQSAGWSAELAPTALDVGGMTWQLESPVTFTLSSDNSVAITGHCWRQTHASLCTQDWALPPKEVNTATLNADVRLLQRWLPADTDIQGPLQAQLSAAWGPNRETTVQLGAEAGPIVLTVVLPEGEQRQLQWRSAVLDAHFNAGVLDLAASVANGEREQLALDLRLPADREQPLSGSLRIEALQLAALTGLSTALGGLDGRLDGELSLGGSVAQPRLNGEIRLQDGRMLLAGNPTELESLELRLLARGDSATLSGQGRLGGGELAVSGELLTTPQPRLTLTLRGQGNTLLYPPATQLHTSSDLTLSAQAGEVALNGEVTVHGGVFEYEQLPDNGVALSDDVVLVDSAGEPLAAEQPIAISTDVRVRVEDGFLLRGPQLEAGLSGDLQLRRRPRQPLEIYGSLNTAGGHATVFERTLQIKRGVVSFSGAPDNPLLDLSAERYISGSDVTAGVRVRGALASDLSLDIYSDPPMPRSEAMSWLVWGRGLNSGTGGDGAVLALSLAGGVVNRSSLVSAINRVPGIDNVAFGAEGDEEDAAATVSGYVGERLYLSYGIGLYEPINVLTARLFLQTRLWLEVVSRLENSVDLYYSFDID